MRFFFIICVCFCSFAYADIQTDVSKIKTITDFDSCAQILKDILLEKIANSNEKHLKLAEEAINHFTATHDFLKLHQNTFTNLGHFHSKDSLLAWELYPFFVKAYSLLNDKKIELDPFFSDKGYLQGTINEKDLKNLFYVFSQPKIIPFVEEDCDPNYVFTKSSRFSEEFLNRDNEYYMLEDEQLQAFYSIFESFKEPINQCLGTPWRILNVRAWKSFPNAEERGPYRWHKDGFPSSVLKIMIYPMGASKENGSIALRTKEGDIEIEGGPGTWVFFKNSEILHKGLISKNSTRFAIEVTITTSLDYDLHPISAGLNARHPHFPWQLPSQSTHPQYGKGEFLGINVGGGPYWSCSGFLNLEEVVSPRNPHSFKFHSNCRFPISNDSLEIVYSSHAMEHLNEGTVCRVLSESHRVLKDNGLILIKIPDYDRALDCWLRQDNSFFGDIWNIESISHLWKKRGLSDCLDQRASMIFCSFWNDSYANPFDVSKAKNLSKAYFGPAVIQVPELRALIQNKTPCQIAKYLYNFIKTNEPEFHFCHQSAWSREELKNLLQKFGFEVISFDPYQIISQFPHITDIQSMKDISTYCLAKKRSKS